MSKSTISNSFNDKGSPSKFKSQDKADMLTEPFKPSKPSRKYVLEIPDLVLNENRKIRPSSWDESDNEIPSNNETPTSENSQIYSGKTEKNAEFVAFELGKIKEQFFNPFNTDVLEDSIIDLSEYSNVSKSPESKVDSKLKLEIDRRQTPARVRRRTRSSNSSSPTHDTKNSQEFTEKADICDYNPHQEKTELEISSNSLLDNLFSDIYTNEWSTLHSKGNLAMQEEKKNNNEKGENSETLIKEIASEEDFYYCRTLRKLSQILEVEEGKKEFEGNGGEGNESLNKNLDNKLSESSLSPQSSQQLTVDNNSSSPVSTSCSIKPCTHNKISPDGFFPSQSSMLLEKLTNLKRNSKGSISDRSYRPFFKNSDSNGFIILTPKSAKTEVDVNEDGDLEFEKSTQDLKNYSYIDSIWTENFLKDFKVKESQENLHLQLSIPTSEETSPRKNKDSSHRSGKVTNRNTLEKDLQLFKCSPKSLANINKNSSRSLKVEDISPNSEKGNGNIKRERRREKIKKSFSVETTTLNRKGYVKSPKSLKSTTEGINSDRQKSIKGNWREECKNDNFKLKSTNYTFHKLLTESFEKSQNVKKSSEENFSSKLQKSSQDSPNSTKNHSPKSNINDLYSSSESFKKDSGRSIESNNSSILLRNSVKENSIRFQNLKSPESDRNSELNLPLSLESPKYHATITMSDGSENSFRKNESPESQKYSKSSATGKVKTNRQDFINKKNSNNFEIQHLNSSNRGSAKSYAVDDSKSNSGSASEENFQEKEKFEISGRQKSNEKLKKSSSRSETEFIENQTDELSYKNKISLIEQEFQEEKEIKKFNEKKDSSRSEEEFKNEFLFFSGDKTLKESTNSSQVSLYDQKEKNVQKVDEIIDSRTENIFCSKSSSRSSTRSCTLKIEEEISDREKGPRSKSSSRKSSHRTLPIIDEASHEAFLKSVESFEEEEASNIHSRRSSLCRSPSKLESFRDANEKLEITKEQKIGENKTGKDISITFLGNVSKRKCEKNSFEEIMWQNLVEKFDESDENLSVNSSALNKFPGFPRKHSHFQRSTESIISSYEIQNKVSKLEIKTQKDLAGSELKVEEKEKNSQWKIESTDNLFVSEAADNKKKIDKRNTYFPFEYNGNKDQQRKMFYFDVKMMDNQNIGEFGDVTCCSLGKFEITSSGKPNIYGDGDQGGRTSWDPITANSMLEKTKKDIEKKSQRQLWTEVNSTYEFEKPLLNIPQIQKADLNFKEYFPMNSFKVLSAAVENHQKSRSVKSLIEEIHFKGNTSFTTSPSLNQRLSNSLKNVAFLKENSNEIKLKQSIYTSTGDLFEMTFQNNKKKKEFSNFNIFLENKKKWDKNIKSKNWLIIGHGKCDSEKSTLRKSRLKKKENSFKESLHAIERISSTRSKSSIPTLRLKNTNCFQNFYKRLISTFCITSHSSAATSK